MTRRHFIAAAVVAALVIGGPFFTNGNALATSLYGLITAAMATAVGIWASWKYSQNSDKDRLTRYGLQAFRTVDSLSIKVSQQIQSGSADINTLQSWLLDIDQAKWSWKDLLRDLFKLQDRLELQQEEVALKFQKQIDSAKDPNERKRLEEESRIEIAKIGSQAPLPISAYESINCPNCGSSISAKLSGDVGASSWPTCESCGALFPIHRKVNSEILVNQEAMRIPVDRSCPICQATNTIKVPVSKDVSFQIKCSHCDSILQFDGNSQDLAVSRIPDQNAF
jgi:transposase-like protein